MNSAGRKGCVVALLLVSACKGGEDPPTDAELALGVAVAACKDAATASSDVVGAVAVQLENRVEGSPQTLRQIRRALRGARGPLARCREFESVDDPQVQACGRAAVTGLKAAHASLRVLSASAQEVYEMALTEAQFYLDEHFAALQECGV
jgi:hypothetical protein